MSPRSSHRIRSIAAASAIAILCAVPASPVSISSGGTTITVSDTHGGITDFITGGTDHLFEADYYFRTGSMTAEDMMTGVNSTYVNSVSASGLEITVSGGTSEFDFTLLYRLDGQGRMVPTLDITNISGGPLDIALFSYQDWDVNGNPGGDRISRNGNVVNVSHGPTTIEIASVTVPNAIEAGSWPTLRNSLRDGSATNLNDGDGLPAGPGDGTFAFQFDLALAAGESTLVIYNVPEPATGVLGGLGLAGLAWSSRKRRA